MSGTDKAYRAILKPGAGQRVLTRAIGPVVLGMDRAQDGFRCTLETIDLNTRSGLLSVQAGDDGEVEAGDRAPTLP